MKELEEKGQSIACGRLEHFFIESVSKPEDAICLVVKLSTVKSTNLFRKSSGQPDVMIGVSYGLKGYW